MSKEMKASLTNPKRLARIGVIAAVHTAATLVAMLFLSGFAWGPIQFRISEALCVLAFFTPDAILGLTLGCFLANLINTFISSFGMLGLFDIIFGSLATFLGAWITWRFRKKVGLALAGPVITNALIVPAYLPILLAGLNFYTIPFTSISLEGNWLLMYLFGLVTTGFGEAVVLFILGGALYQALLKTPIRNMLQNDR